MLSITKSKIQFLIIALLFPCIILAQEKKDSLPAFWYADSREIYARLDELFNDPALNNALWGISVKSLSKGDYLYQKNVNSLMMPASNLKLITTAAALEILGSNYRIKTEFYTAGKLDGSILRGDLIVKGYGDPAISGRFTDDRVLKYFEDWADTIAAMGIDEIAGNLVGIDDVFDESGLGEGWSWDYESYWFAAPTGALSLNDNCIDIYVRPTRPGSAAYISTNPNSDYVTIINKVVTVTEDSATTIDINRLRGTNVIIVTGVISAADELYKTYGTITNPTQYFLVVLKSVFDSKGIKIRGLPIDYDDYDKALLKNAPQLVFTHYSVPLSELVRVINKNSQNFFAEQLLKIIGYEVFGHGTAYNGVKAVKNILKTMGVEPEEFQMVDGSGLSRLNLITPVQLLTVLSYMSTSKNYSAYYASLPVAGLDGTLSGRMRKTSAQGNVRGKTGFIGSVRSLSGYLKTADKEPLAFVFILNNYITPRILADNIQDSVCIRLSNLKRKK